MHNIFKNIWNKIAGKTDEVKTDFIMYIISCTGKASAKCINIKKQYICQEKCKYLIQVIAKLANKSKAGSSKAHEMLLGLMFVPMQDNFRHRQMWYECLKAF